MDYLPFSRLPSHADLALLPLSVDHNDMKAAFGKKENEYSRIVAKSSSKLLNTLWETKKIPDDGWSDHSLELFLSWVACHDSNNRVDLNPVGAGEREGRVVCSFVQRLNCNLSHGIGRSGNLCEIQPKALGSSMLACLANEFALHALQELGYQPIIVDSIREGDSLITDTQAINRILEQRGPEILCVLSTTSCFAPRSPDSLEAISAVCKLHAMPHLVNNAYGLQSEECIRRLNAGRAAGRIDAFVQSLDKNFQVPVGGAVIGVFKQTAIHPIAQFYPGRASCVPSRDFVLTLLHQGLTGFMETFERQRRVFHKMKRKLKAFAADIGECVYDVDDNHISLAMTLSSIPLEKQTLFGSILFSRGITGARVVTSTSKVTMIEGCEFVNFGSHTPEQHGGYLNIASGIGMSDNELDELFTRLTSAFAKFVKQMSGGSTLFVPKNGRTLDEFDEDDD